MYTINGQILHIMDTETVTENFKKRLFVLEDTSGSYRQEIEFQTIQQRTELLDQFNVGDIVKVDFFIRGRKHQKEEENKPPRWFNSLDVVKIAPL